MIGRVQKKVVVFIEKRVLPFLWGKADVLCFY